MEIGCSIEDVQALLLGGHGDDMVPLPRLTSVHGIPVTDLLPDDKITACVERAKAGGGEVVKLMGTSAYYAPASGAISMAESFLKGQRRLIACAAYLQGEYGYKDLYMGVPILIGPKGLEKVVEVKLSAEEKAGLEKSAEAVRELIAAADKL
jgi:malate dehydrogenase